MLASSCIRMAGIWRQPWRGSRQNRKTRDDYTIIQNTICLRHFELMSHFSLKLHKIQQKFRTCKTTTNTKRNQKYSDISLCFFYNLKKYKNSCTKKMLRERERERKSHWAKNAKLLLESFTSMSMDWWGWKRKSKQNGKDNQNVFPYSQVSCNDFPVLPLHDVFSSLQARMQKDNCKKIVAKNLK